MTNVLTVFGETTPNFLPRKREFLPLEHLVPLFVIMQLNHQWLGLLYMIFYYFKRKLNQYHLGVGVKFTLELLFLKYFSHKRSSLISQIPFF